MDLIDYDKNIYEKLSSEYISFSKKLNFKKIKSIPISALKGDNIHKKSKNMKWYSDKTLFDYLETTKSQITNKDGFIFPVQRVNRPDLNFRGYSGTINGGKIKKGDELISLPSNQKAKVKDILIGEKSIKSAVFKAKCYPYFK